jgi:hypothetical protein
VRLFSALLVCAFALVLVLSIVPLQAHATTSVTFNQVNYFTPTVQDVPSSVTWGICIGSTTYASCTSAGGTTYTGTGPSITVTGLSGTETFSYQSTVTGAAGYEYVCYTGSCSGTLSGSTPETAEYLTYYQISFAVSPSGSGTISPITTQYYYQSETVAVYATPNTGYEFSSFSSTNSSNTFAAPVPSGTYTYAVATIYGPGTITANFVAGTYSVTFTQLNYEAQTSVGIASGASVQTVPE